MMITVSTYQHYESTVWALVLVDAISECYNGHVCVAGSYAMIKAIDYVDKSSYSNLESRSAAFSSVINSAYANDVDIWVPMVHQAIDLNPDNVQTTPMDVRRSIIREMAELEAPMPITHREELSLGNVVAYSVDSATVLGSIGFAEINGHIREILPVLNTRLPEGCVARVTSPEAEINGQEAPDPNGYGQWFYMTDGVSLRLKVVDRATDAVILNLQVIVNNIVPTGYESWAQCVVNQFDITSSRVAFVTRDSPPVFGQNALNDILHGEFQYLVKPCMSFKRCWTRIMEYTRKGFILKFISYDSECSTEYKDYMNRRFQHLYIGELGTRALIELGMDYEMAANLCHEHIAPYFNINSPWKEEMLLFSICDNQVSFVANTAGYFQCSGMPVDIRSYQHFARVCIRHTAARYIQRYYRMHLRRNLG